ncbi:MAG TPA: UDP-N-acetylmuramoyl-L-alanyl-D-glutamate--2,6-diaminopimelate ligase [Gemmatimonadaceae bacterium]|nr:UDP-N-acetylmuramoyl-L-alanyl-D-glutamate--2,6-diaminopimelate ligase [Gemmatimonadaceae bacterium]
MAIPTQRITAALSAADLLVEVRGSLPDVISSLEDDSRRVTAGALFIAVRGSERDGHAFLASAATAGAAAAIVEDPVRTTLPSIVVRDGRRAAAIAASAAYDWPVRQLQLTGVTGTNGKTTTVHVLRHLLDRPSARAASIGTLGVLIGSEGRELEDVGLTTPGPVALQRLLRALVDAGVRHVAMEVSSHALDQHRVDGLVFETAVFTNLSRDHLDYHKTMDAYLAAKARLLEYLAPHGTVVVNADDPAWRSLVVARRRVSFSTRAETTEVHARKVTYTPRGSDWTLVLDGSSRQLRLPLIGDFNVANAVGAAAAAFALGSPLATIAERLATLPQVPGRLEIIHERPTVLRDYAHTPDALERALAAVRPFATHRLIAVFGAGGDRDRGKRPVMGEIAERLADFCIVTSDNPRTENPDAILDEIEGGMRRDNHERIEDRRDAIARALTIADASDVVLLAGKGHETYQIRGTEKLHFDEREIVAELSRVRA